MNNYMRVMPLRCPKCKKTIPHMDTTVKAGKEYFVCPECGYCSKSSDKFVDKKKFEEENNIQNFITVSK